MPTYEYRCPEGHNTERFFRKMSEATSEIECPVCGKTAARQVSGGAGLLFKGSGFYLTDYGKNAHRGAAPETKSTGKSDTSKSGGDGGSERKGDSAGGTTAKETKPADKPASKAPETKPSSTKKADS